jgi:hypothetical protein
MPSSLQIALDAKGEITKHRKSCVFLDTGKETFFAQVFCLNIPLFFDDCACRPS